MKIKTNVEGKEVTITLTKEQLKDIKKQTSDLITIEELNYSSACKLLNQTYRNDASATDQLLMIIKAANFIDNDYKVWSPDFLDSDQYKYLPYWKREVSGWVLSFVYSYCYRSGCSVGFYFKNEDTAKLIANNFVKLYNKVLG